MIAAIDYDGDRLTRQIAIAIRLTLSIYRDDVGYRRWAMAWLAGIDRTRAAANAADAAANAANAAGRSIYWSRQAGASINALNPELRIWCALADRETYTVLTGEQS